MAPSTSDEQIEKNVTSCSNDDDEPQAIAETITDEKCTMEMESHQLPSSSTEEDHCVLDTDANTAMDKNSNGDESSIRTKSPNANSKMVNEEEMIECTVDSSGVINKCDSEIIEDMPTNTAHVDNTLSECTAIAPTIDKSDNVRINSEMDHVNATNESINLETVAIAESEMPESSDACNSSSSASKCDNNRSDADKPINVKRDETNDEQNVNDNNEEHCDSNTESVTDDTEQISSVQNNNKVLDSNVNSKATVDHLDSKIEQIEQIAEKCEIDRTEQQENENGSYDCDSSDILVETHAESDKIGAISVTDTKLSNVKSPETCNDMELSNDGENTHKHEQEVNEQKQIPEQNQEQIVENKENEENNGNVENVEKIVEIVEPIQIDFQTDEKSSTATFTGNDVQTQMDIDPKTQMKEVNEQTVSNSDNSGVADKIVETNSSDSMPIESKTIDVETKCSYDVNESVSSPEIAPIGFKDKFKKSFEIMEKSKQESISFEKMEKLNDEKIQLLTENEQSQQSIGVIDKSRNKVNQTIKSDTNELNASASPQNTTEIVGSVNETCDLTIDDKSEENSNSNSEPTINCDSLKEKLKRQDYAFMQTESSTHSSFDCSEQQQKQQQQLHSADSRKDIIKSSATPETRTIIVTPNSRARFDRIESKSDESKVIFNADSLSAKCGSLYVNNPDFSKSLRPSMRDLSELKMKPPDFSKMSRSSELHVPNPDFTKAYDKLHDTQRRSPIPSDVNPSNFAEISKKYNYISDLQLKNPLPTTSKTNEPTQSTCTSLYVKPPDFSSKLRNQADNNESEAIEEPTPHIIHKNLYRPHADSSSKINTPPPAKAQTPITATTVTASTRSTPIQSDYPQISDDITMSLVQHGVEPKVSQMKMVAPSKPPTPVHRIENRATAAGAAASNQPSPSHIYSPTSLERRNSSNYYPHPVHSADKSMSTVQKINNDEMYQRNLTVSSAHQYTSSAHMFHRDVPVTIGPNQKIHHAYEQYASSEKPPLPKSIHSTMEMNTMRSTNDPYNRPSSANLLYHEPNRNKPIHSAQEMQPSSSNHINAYNYPSGRPASAHNMNKPADYYCQMNPPQKWPSQTRITQSPISSAPSPHSIIGSNTSTPQQIQYPVSASPLPYQMHRQSPSNLQYQSPHTTPSPSPFGYSSSPVPVKPNKLPTNAPVNNIPSQSRSF